MDIKKKKNRNIYNKHNERKIFPLKKEGTFVMCVKNCLSKRIIS